MESPPQNPGFKINPEKFQPCAFVIGSQEVFTNLSRYQVFIMPPMMYPF